MTTFSRRRILALLGASTAIALIAAPYNISMSGFSPELQLSAAYAKDGHSGGDDSSGSGSSGSDDGDDGDSSGSGGGGGDDDDDDDDDGGADEDDDDDDNDDDDDDDEHINPITGDKVEIDGSDIEVLHADGTKEEIERGRYEMKDANGRTIVERPATEVDRARLVAMAG